jgi:hypothetical protein
LFFYPINFDNNSSWDEHAMSISLFEQEYHYEDFEQNKYQVSEKKN